MGTYKRRLEVALKRLVTRDEVWKKIHTKSKLWEEAWVKTRAEEAYNRYKEAVKELVSNQPTDEQGQPITPTEKETLPLWLNVVGGVYKGRAYVPPSVIFIASRLDYKVLGHSPPCKMRTLRRCGQ